MKTVLSISVLVMTIACALPALADSLTGNPDAVALAEQMLETLGGKTAWTEARMVTVELRGYYAREQEPWYETYWMELEDPRGRFELRGETDRVIAWTPDGGWELSNGTAEAMDSTRHAFELEYWKHQPVVVFHRLAKGVPATRVEMGTNEYRFDVFDAESDALLAQFAVNMKGEPIKWGATIGEQEFEQVFGPLGEFTNVSMPKWGATITGVWRYEHVSISLAKTPPPVSYEIPRGD
jgi:hypothetical protein